MINIIYPEYRIPKGLIMAEGLLVELSRENDQLQKTLDDIERIAQEQHRGLTQADIDLMERTKNRQKDVIGQCEVLARQEEMSDAARTRIAKLSGGINNAQSAVEYRTAAEYLWDFAMADIAQDSKIKTQCRQRLETYNRAAQHVITDDYQGIFPNTVVGPVLSFIDASRPFLSAIGVKGIPGGPSFRRPKLIDDHLSDGVGIQANQKDELVSQKFTIDSDQVDLATIGGYVNVARQVFDWGVASLNTIVDQLAARYAYYTERAALIEVVKSTSKIDLAAGAASDVVVKAIYDAAALYYEKTGTMATLLVAGPKGWASLGATSDTAGRQIFPFLNPSNASGGSMSANSFAGNPVGLNLVVTPAITDTDLWVTGPLGIEAYEQTVGQLNVVEPSVLGIQVSYSGYVGFYRPAGDGSVLIAP